MRAEGLLNGDIAEAMGLSTAAIKSRVYRMRKRGQSVAPTAYHGSAT